MAKNRRGWTQQELKDRRKALFKTPIPPVSDHPQLQQQQQQQQQQLGPPKPRSLMARLLALGNVL